MPSSYLLSHQVRDVLLVLQANIIQQLRIGCKDLRNLDGPRLRVGLRIIDRELDFQRPVVRAPESFRDPGVFRERTAPGIEPQPVAETGSLHDQSIPFPFPRRVAVPGWARIDWQRPRVGEDL